MQRLKTINKNDGVFIINIIKVTKIKFYSQDLNIENLSVCSWEAVEDRSGPSSGANSATNDLWVPDHAVSSCTGCHTEFWLGRRKHHCR